MQQGVRTPSRSSPRIYPPNWGAPRPSGHSDMIWSVGAGSAADGWARAGAAVSAGPAAATGAGAEAAGRDSAAASRRQGRCARAGPARRTRARTTAEPTAMTKSISGCSVRTRERLQPSYRAYYRSGGHPGGASRHTTSSGRGSKASPNASSVGANWRKMAMSRSPVAS